MLLTGKAKKDFNHWRFNVKGYRRNFTPEYNDLVVNGLIEQWFNEKSIYFLPTPILGDKNGYDSYPIIGWRCDVLTPNRNDTNSFYLGYPVMEWYVYQDLEKGEDFKDINIKVFENFNLAKIDAIKKVGENYNLQQHKKIIMNITDSIAKSIGGDIGQLIHNNKEIQFYANDNTNTYQWRDSRFHGTSNVWENKDAQTRPELIEIFKEHINKHKNLA